MTQNDQILEHLLSGQSITPLDALNLYNCFRLGARIRDLRVKGYDIITETEEKGGKHYARYYMKLEPKQLELISA